ncbi:helix-turn-helix domain-containing protein [Chryseobacterium sp. MHB01]|uniref:helix-turn-helix domain-containing protein n=1 Tax=Chryseobacterium sp. MHB01 TaxID=3109433 RepID=UPI002AFFB3FA|nr:helix-turn-helix domain-containing protein [Chryseobacterium sp. MHB01]MEA1848994.1 helix-turn-helix domain-containing protein [Chryseobacterium sp. MHB01]
MNTLVLTPEDFIQQLKNALIPELKQQLKNEFQPKEPEEYLTVKEVCSLLKVTTPTVSRWRKENKIPSYGIGDRVYFKRSEIEAVINRNKI